MHGGDGAMSGQDLHGALMAAMATARECQGQMYPLAADAAAAKREYRKAKRLRILWERAENRTPVSLIADVVSGYEDIGDLCAARDCAEAAYQANYEALLLAKKEIDVLREVIAREWGRQ